MSWIMIKGGVWRNTEDQVLKTSVKKYGKNQWLRIAALLHKKSAEQSRIQWFEWLNPIIKAQWNQEEEEKLLQLAKVMPSQWRTIASIIGRTVSQCIEYYEYLLVQAVKKDDDNMVQNLHKLKPEETKPNSEVKAIHSNYQDMTESRRKILEIKAKFADIRLRLASIQDKKAKRKALEIRLEEVRHWRLSVLRRRREFKRFGIDLEALKTKAIELDCKAEISFKSPIPGLYNKSVYL